MQLSRSLVAKTKGEAWCLVIICMAKLSKNVLNTHLVNLEAYTVEYSQKLQILLFTFGMIGEN